LMSADVVYLTLYNKGDRCGCCVAEVEYKGIQFTQKEHSLEGE